MAPSSGKITLSKGDEGYLAAQAQELGLLGKIFGSASEKPGNIAGLIVVVSFLAAIGALVLVPDAQSFGKKDAFLALLGVTTLALGYLFGRGSR